jgi:hypothetical protein
MTAETIFEVLQIFQSTRVLIKEIVIDVSGGIIQIDLIVSIDAQTRQYGCVSSSVINGIVHCSNFLIGVLQKYNSKITFKMEHNERLYI